MGTIQRAKQVLDSAEHKLRELMQSCIELQDYSSVAEIAKLADGVARLRKGESSITQMVESKKIPPRFVNRQKISKPPSSRKKAVVNRTYPQFKIEDGKLVKVGWSKKNRSEYEHRAPREVVEAFINYLRSHVDTGKVFSIEKLMPIYDDAGQELPAYQVYLTLAWLRDVGVIEKKGRNGYMVKISQLENGSLNAHWVGLNGQRH